MQVVIGFSGDEDDLILTNGWVYADLLEGVLARRWENEAVGLHGNIYYDSLADHSGILRLALLLDDLHDLMNQLLELQLGDPAIAVGVNRSHEVVDVGEGGLLDVEGHGDPADELPELVLLEVAGVVHVEFLEGCGQFFGGHCDHLVRIHGVSN